jgi:drug/metabolite transporter (DMT)-like permease
LVPPITGVLSYFLFHTRFSNSKLIAVGLSVTGVLMGCFVQFFYETTSDQFKSTGFAIMLLVFSAITHSLQHVLEERLFRKDKMLSVVQLDVMEVFWKNLLVFGTIPILSRIPMPVSFCSSGVVENNLDAIYEVVNDKTLINLLCWGVLSFVMMQFLSLFIIHMANAMSRVMVALIKTFLLWIFFMLWPGYGHEDFNWIKMIGMFLLAIGTVIFVKLETEELD